MSNNIDVPVRIIEKEPIADSKKTWIDKLIDYFNNDTENTKMEIKRLDFEKRQFKMKMPPHQKME